MRRREVPNAHRDHELGDALRALGAPEHRPGFHDELRKRLAADRGASVRRKRIRWAVRGAAALAVAAVVVLAVGVPRLTRNPAVSGPAQASAATVQTHLRQALVQMRNLSADLVVSDVAANAPARWHFTVDSRGDFRVEGPAAGEWITYDATTGVARSAQRSASIGGSTLFYAERTGVAPGPPDQGPPTWILPEEFGAFVRAALAAGDPAVRDVVFEGHPAWRLAVDARPNLLVPASSADAFEITVDRASGMPLQVIERRNGKTLRELRLERLAVNRDLPPGEFERAFPAGVEVMRSDDGFRRSTLPGAARTAGYAPLVPTAVPDGYTLAAVAVADHAPPAGDGNPASEGVVSLDYRRGLDEFVVTTRLRGSSAWRDPFAAPGAADTAQAAVIADGAIAGTTARIVVAPGATPHLWATTSELVVTVSGDLSRAQLSSVASSLERRRS